MISFKRIFPDCFSCKLKHVSSTSEEVIPLCKNRPSLPDFSIIELRNDIQKTVLTAKTRNKLNPMGSSLDIQAVRILKNFALDNTITEAEKEILTKYGVNDDWLNDFDGV